MNYRFKIITDTASAQFLDIYFEYDNSGHFNTRIYDKRGDFNFTVINLPDLSVKLQISSVCALYSFNLQDIAAVTHTFVKRHWCLTYKQMIHGLSKTSCRFNVHRL